MLIFSYEEFREIFLPSKFEYYQMIKEREGTDYAYKHKEMSDDSLYTIIQFLKILLRNEIIADGQKKLLNQNMSSKEAFSLLLNNGKDLSLNKNSFKWFLEDMCIFPSLFESDVLFKRFNRNLDERVSFSQVMTIIYKYFYLVH